MSKKKPTTDPLIQNPQTSTSQEAPGAPVEPPATETPEASHFPPEPPLEPIQTPPDDLVEVGDAGSPVEAEQDKALAQKIEDKPVQRANQALTHLQALAGRKLTVPEFREATNTGVGARGLLDGYMSQGLVQRAWVAGEGRYALSPAGMDFVAKS